MDTLKTVLVKLRTTTGDGNRPIIFNGGVKELYRTTKDKFVDLLWEDSKIYLQILDEI